VDQHVGMSSETLQHKYRRNILLVWRCDSVVQENRLSNILGQFALDVTCGCQVKILCCKVALIVGLCFVLQGCTDCGFVLCVQLGRETERR
jgi:hypothetical protein